MQSVYPTLWYSYLHLVDAARCAALIQTEFYISCDIYLTGTIFQTRSRKIMCNFRNVPQESIEWFEP